MDTTEKLVNYLVDEFTKKQNLANVKAIMSCDTENLDKTDTKEMFYYLGYRQAVKDIVAALNGKPYIFTEYEEANITFDDVN